MTRAMGIFALVAALLAVSGLAAHRSRAQPLALGEGPKAFSAAAAPPAPDYRNPAAWAARPGRASDADLTPAGTGLVPIGAAAKADVFYIHPTTYLAGGGWNAAYDAGGTVGQRVDHAVLAYQASVFNGCCRIFAPRYRQAHLAAFRKNTPDGEAALDLAYSDVLRAFDDYIAHDNHGRPFIIAGHSQGALHAMRLLQERVIGTPLRKQLVAAYVIGGFLPTDIEAKGLPICRTARQTGCVIDWNSIAAGHAATRRSGAALMWLDGRYQPSAGHDIVCVDPLDWRAGGAAPASANLGSVPVIKGQPGLAAPVAHLTGADCADDMLVVDIPIGRREGFRDVLTLMGIYHDLDYNLFYLNMRQNAAERVAGFAGK